MPDITIKRNGRAWSYNARRIERKEDMTYVTLDVLEPVGLSAFDWRKIRKNIQRIADREEA